MISKQILQNAVDGLKNITRKEFTIVSRETKIIAATEAMPVSLSHINSVIETPKDHVLIENNLYFKIPDNDEPEYILVVSGSDSDSFRAGELAAFHINALSAAYKERSDRDYFIKNLILDNLPLSDIYSRAKKFRIENGVRRVLYLIETSMDTEMNSPEILREIFPDRSKDFIIALDEKSIVLVKEINERDTADDIEQTAFIIADTLTAEIMTSANVAISSLCKDLKNIPTGYNEARLAQEIRNIFEMEKQVINYERLGIGRLIYQLPLNLCHTFLNEMLQYFTMEDIDEELFVTVQKFFENDLNISKTAQDLFIHRNTLVFRLDKFQKLTRLDIRKFNDAIKFKITLMVTRYIEAVSGRENND